MNYKFETDEGLVLKAELLEEFYEGGRKYETWSITIQPLSGYTVMDHGEYMWPKNTLNVEVNLSISKEEAIG